jgi:hypothetical protein
MYVVVTKVSVASGRIDDAVEQVKSRVLPELKSQAGYKVGYFTRSDDGSNGQSFVIFESKEHADAAAAGRSEPPPGSAFRIDSVEVREVIASG